ncbi:MAG: cytochrome c3 family protein [Deltaproteobacteria bacterium]|nr:cytochrome c3 family protein [Deltaproteobacteria bacterium]
MMKRFSLLIVLIMGVGALMIPAGLYAGTEVPDVIKLENKAYKKHKKGIVLFNHKKHQEDYAKKEPDLYKTGCGECHHDENNKPLSGLKVGDPVKGCIECHKEPGEMPAKVKKAMRRKKLSRKEQKSKKLVYHAEALHYNCKDCHRKYNKKHKLRSKDKGYAPNTCASCHPKKKK